MEISDLESVSCSWLDTIPYKLVMTFKWDTVRAKGLQNYNDKTEGPKQIALWIPGETFLLHKNQLQWVPGEVFFSDLQIFDFWHFCSSLSNMDTKYLIEKF